MARKITYWNTSDNDLMADLDGRGIKYKKEEWDRKSAIALLQKHDAAQGALGEMGAEDDDGKLTGDILKQVKKDVKDAGDVPKLMLRRVMFLYTNETDLPYIFVGVNGRCFYLPKEVEMDVPVYILDGVIRDAVEDRLVQIVDKAGEISWDVKKVNRFPYSIIAPDFPADEGE